MEATDPEYDCDLNKNRTVPLLFFQPLDVWINCTFQHFGKQILLHVIAKGMFQCHCWGGCRGTTAFRKQPENLICVFFMKSPKTLCLLGMFSSPGSTALLCLRWYPKYFNLHHAAQAAKEQGTGPKPVSKI